MVRLNQAPTISETLSRDESVRRSRRESFRRVPPCTWSLTGTATNVSSGHRDKLACSRCRVRQIFAAAPSFLQRGRVISSTPGIFCKSADLPRTGILARERCVQARTIAGPDVRHLLCEKARPLAVSAAGNSSMPASGFHRAALKGRVPDRFLKATLKKERLHHRHVHDRHEVWRNQSCLER